MSFTTQSVYTLDLDQLEELRTECAKRGQMELFSHICLVIGREEDDDYVYYVSTDETDESDIENSEEDEEVAFIVKDGFHELI